jgi:hypothetical protein
MSCLENSCALPASAPLQLIMLLKLSYRIREEPKKQIEWGLHSLSSTISRCIWRLILLIFFDLVFFLDLVAK